jgi:hypothetical protein
LGGGNVTFSDFVDPFLTIAPGTPNAGDYSIVYGPGIQSSVPEPSTWAMMLLGFAGLGLAGYRNGRRKIAITA